MKHDILLIAYAICGLFLVSCSNDITAPSNSNEKALANLMANDTSIIFVNSIADLNRDLSIPDYTSPFLGTKANLINHTAIGFDETSYKYKDAKLSFGANLAAIIGVDPYVVYIVDEYKLTKRIPQAGGYVVPLASPKCGFVPTSSNNEIGYSSTILNDKFEMTTITINVKYNMSGRYLNIWSPRQNSVVEWNYGTIL